MVRRKASGHGVRSCQEDHRRRVRVISGAVDRATGKEGGGYQNKSVGLGRDVSNASSDVERTITGEAALRYFLRQEGGLSQEESWVISRKAKGFLRYWLQAEEEEKEAVALAERLRDGYRVSGTADDGSAWTGDVNGNGWLPEERQVSTRVTTNEAASSGNSAAGITSESGRDPCLADEADATWHLRSGVNELQARDAACQDADGSSVTREEKRGSEVAVDEQLGQWLIAKWQSGRSPGVLVAVLESVGLKWEEAVRVSQAATSASKKSTPDHKNLLMQQFRLVSSLATVLRSSISQRVSHSTSADTVASSSSSSADSNTSDGSSREDSAVVVGGVTGGEGGDSTDVVEECSSVTDDISRSTRECGSSSGNGLPFMARYLQRVVPRLAVLQQPEDERLRQSLTFFQKVAARPGGISSLDDPDVALRTLLFSFPQVLSLNTVRQAQSQPGSATAGNTSTADDSPRQGDQTRVDDGGWQSDSPIGIGVTTRRQWRDRDDGEIGGTEDEAEDDGKGEGEKSEDDAQVEPAGQAVASQAFAPPSLLLPDVLHFLAAEWGLSPAQLRTALLIHPAAALAGSLDNVVTAKRALKKVGVRVQADMPAIARRFPLALLTPSLAANVEPLSRALHQVLKIPESRIERLITRYPELLSVSPSLDVPQTKALLSSLGLTGRQASRVVQASPQVLCRTSKELEENLDWLRHTAGVPSSDLAHVIYRSPAALTTSLHILDSKLSFLSSLANTTVSSGTPPLSTTPSSYTESPPSSQASQLPSLTSGSTNETLPHRPSTSWRRPVPVNISRIVRRHPEVLVTSTAAMQERVDFLIASGFSPFEVRCMVERFPPLLGYSVSAVLQPKLAMWQAVLGLPLSDLASFPKFFSFSLDRRVQRRMRLLGHALQEESVDGRADKPSEPIGGGDSAPSTSLMSFKTNRPQDPKQEDMEDSGAVRSAPRSTKLSPDRLAYLLSCSDDAFLSVTLGLQSLYLPISSIPQQNR